MENLLEFDAINVTITDIRHIKKKKKEEQTAGFRGSRCPLLWLSSHFKFSCICDAFRFWLRIRVRIPISIASPSPCIIQQNVCHTNYGHTIPSSANTDTDNCCCSSLPSYLPVCVESAPQLQIPQSKTHTLGISPS